MRLISLILLGFTTSCSLVEFLPLAEDVLEIVEKEIQEK